VVYVIVYNTSLVKEADAPKSWSDLLDPRWDGKIGIWVRGEGQGALAASWGIDKVVDYVRKMNARHPVLLPSTFPLAQQVAAGEILVGFGLNHSAQIPIRRGAPIKVVVADPAPISTLYSFVPVKAKNPSGGALLALWLATPEGAKAYEDATDRGNPFIPSTKTYALLRGHPVSQFTVEQAPQEAEVVQRINKMIESRETQ
jgi:iron(III) transport system substrate-binding protein